MQKKKVTAVAAIATAAALLLGSTFAWQSISQTALNETDDIINPGGRLHDDFDGSNKDVYVENFADNPIFARIRLDEYFEITMNKNTPAEATEVITTGATKDDTSSYLTHYFDQENLTDTYWDWATGGSTTYMPTFNKNKDSLKADINGTYEQNFDDYVDYTQTTEKTDNAVYDADSNSVEDDGVKTVEETHHVATTESGTLISIYDWLNLYNNDENISNYWVYDYDGWVYWSSPIEPNTASGLLLDGISLKDKMDDSYYYAINVIAQFVTADDVGSLDNTGFYDSSAGPKPSDSAVTLLQAIGVDVPEETYPVGDVIYSLYATKDDGSYEMILFSSDSYISKTQAVNITGVNEDDVVTFFEMTEDRKNYAAANYNGNVSSVRFANEVKPDNMSRYFAVSSIYSASLHDITFDWTNLDTSNVYDMSEMFENCVKLTELDLSSFDTSNVYDMSSMFLGCSSLKSITFGENWDTSNVCYMYSLFFLCSELTSLDLSMFDTSSVRDMSSLMDNCNKLTSVTFGDGWDTSKVYDFSWMFSDCNNISQLDLSKFDVSSVTNMRGMFEYCYNLSSISLGEGWNTSKVENMDDLFYNCRSLTLDCSSWSVDLVTTQSSFRYNAETASDIETIIEPIWVNG